MENISKFLEETDKFKAIVDKINAAEDVKTLNALTLEATRELQSIYFGVNTLNVDLRKAVAARSAYLRTGQGMATAEKPAEKPALDYTPEEKLPNGDVKGTVALEPKKKPAKKRGRKKASKK